MRAPRRLAALSTDQRGAVLVTFALFAPVAILLAAFTTDAGNWFLHKRHLQVQADAAVFAAAREFQPCLDANVYSRAGQYGGVHGGLYQNLTTPAGGATSTTPVYNEQVGYKNEIERQNHTHELINSKRYYEQPSPVDETAVEKPPCVAGMVDVKLTETELPWIWEHVLNVSHINAHARIAIFHQTSAKGLSPLAVAESAPVDASAYFVNEDKNNTVIAKTPLTKLGSNGKGQDVWANSTAPLTVPLSKTNGSTANIGVVIALSGKTGDTACPTHELVKCYGPLLHVAGYSNVGKGTVTVPLARQVTLSNPSPNTCTDGYFSNASGSCTFAIAAKVDYGSAITKGITITPQIGATKEKAALTFNVATGLWTGTATLSAGSGNNEVSLVVECKKEAGSPCEKTSNSSATIKNVHRIFSASTGGSGTITGAWLSEIGGLPQDANTFEACEGCTHKLVVTVNVGGSLADAQSVSDPVFPIRDTGPNKTKVACPPGVHSASEYEESLIKGCPGTYQVNTTDPNCTAKSGTIDCVSLFNGASEGPFVHGVERRLKENPGYHYYCPNNWSKFPALPADDSRVIQVFIVPYAAAEQGGEVPIQDFAAFYVTGYDKDPCETGEDPAVNKNEIVGHFIKYINTIGGGNPEEKCLEDPLGECVTVLTR